MLGTLFGFYFSFGLMPYGQSLLSIEYQPLPKGSHYRRTLVRGSLP